MQFLLPALALCLTWLNHASCIIESNVTTDYDALVIGGGPSGLATMSSLVRVGWRALMFDSGDYRNIQTRYTHDVIGNDGTAPWIFRQTARQQISEYPTATMMNATIVSIQNVNNGSYFIATDSNGQNYTGRKVVMATGIKDVVPASGELQQLFGKGIFWCPWCDGWEHRNQPIGVLSPLGSALGHVFDLPNLYQNIVIYTNGTQTDDVVAALNVSRPGWQDQLAVLNIPINNKTVLSIDRLNVSGPAGTESSGDGGFWDPTTREEYDYFEITFTDGSTANTSAILGVFPTTLQSPSLASQLGIQIVGGRLGGNASTKMLTNVTGVWSVGDANADNSTNVYHAMWSGKSAAINVHGTLMKEGIAYLVTNADGQADGNKTASQDPNGFKRRSLKKLSEGDMEQLLKRDLEDMWEHAVAESKRRLP